MSNRFNSISRVAPQYRLYNRCHSRGSGNLVESLIAHLKLAQESGVDYLPFVGSGPIGVGGVGRRAPDSAQPVASTGGMPSEDRIRSNRSSNEKIHHSNRSNLLEQLRADIGDCTRCPLHKGRTHLVFGVGSPDAELMFVGEGPGADEDRQGEPFVGRAGKLLTKMIGAMGLQRQDVYICNVIKCRPPGNRNPEPVEVATCSPFLKKQIAIIGPKVIVTLGKFAAQILLQTEIPITKLRGEFHDYGEAKLMPTYHPAFLLRNPAMKRPVWEDLKKVMKVLNLPDR